MELQSLDAGDFERILTEPENSLIRQYTELLGTEGVTLQFEADAIQAIARVASEINSAAENIGARRLHTVMEQLLEEISFEAPDHSGTTHVVRAATVEERLRPLLSDRDLARYIL